MIMVDKYKCVNEKKPAPTKKMILENPIPAACIAIVMLQNNRNEIKALVIVCFNLINAKPRRRRFEAMGLFFIYLLFL